MEDTLYQHVEHFLNQLAQAWRAVQLYPGGNPRIREAVSAAVLAAQALGGAQARNATDSEKEPSPGNEDFTIIRVTRQAFLLADTPVAPRRQGLRRLAEDLYGQGVKFLWLRPGLSASELEGLLVIATAAENASRFAEALEEAAFDHIGLEVIEDFQLVDRTPDTIRMDMLGYLRNKQARRRAPLDAAGPCTDDLPEDEDEDLSDLAEFFLDIAQGSEEKIQYLYNNLSDPRRLAETLTYLASMHPADEDGVEMPADVLRQTLGHIADTIKQLPADVRESMVRNIAKAVLTAGQAVRSKVVDSALAAAVGKDSFVAEVCAYLPNDVIGQLLTAHIRLHRGTASTLSNFLDDFSGDEQRRQTIKRLVACELRQSGDTIQCDVLAILDQEPPTDPFEAKKPAPETRTERETMETVREAHARELTLAKNEIASLTEAIGQVNAEDNLGRAAMSLIALRRAGHIPELEAPAWKTIRHALERAVDRRRFVFSARCLEGLRLLATRENDETARETVEIFTARLGKDACLSRILEALLSAGHGDEPYRALLTLVAHIGERAYETLFDMLANEQDRRTRRRLILAFLDLGDETVYFLCRTIEHRHWYVVRNVTYLLGKLGLPAGIEAIERVLYHPDIRVRREVLRAAATIRGPEAEGLLRRCLHDDEPVIRGLAAEWLAIIKAQGILEEFRAMLETNDKRLRSCHEFAAGVVRALGRLGDTADVPLIERFKQQSYAFSIIRHSHVAEACDKAIDDIRRKQTAPSAAGARESSPP